MQPAGPAAYARAFDGVTKHDERARMAGYYQHRADARLQRRYRSFNPGHLFLQQRLERDLLAALARHGYTGLRRHSILDVGCGDGSFDLVFQFTVLSSVLDDQMRVAIAREMARVLAPDGVIVSYDFVFARDRRNTRPLTRRELRELFPGFVMDARRVTLFPPLSRALAERSWIACELLETIPFLRGHELVVLRKPSIAKRRGEPSSPSLHAGGSRDR